MAEATIQETLDDLNSRVWVGVPSEEVQQDHEAKVIGCRRVIHNKNDQTDPDVRARLAAQEVNVHDDAAFFAATHPSKSNRVLCSQWASERARGGGTSQACGYPQIMFMADPPGNGSSACHLNLKWGKTWSRGSTCVCMAAEIQDPYGKIHTPGHSSTRALWLALLQPCCFYHPQWDLHCVVHGDELTCLGCDGSLNNYDAATKERFELKVKGKFGKHRVG